MRSPRATEDIEAVEVRARVRLERRLRTRPSLATGAVLGDVIRHDRLAREAAGLVAALQGRLDENMERWSHGDR